MAERSFSLAIVIAGVSVDGRGAAGGSGHDEHSG